MKSPYPLVLLLGAFVILAGAYSLVIPLGEASDEVSHWAYVQYLVTEHGLPPSEGAALGEAHQAPLYYMIEAVATAWIGAGEFQPTANPDFSLDNPQAPNLLLHSRMESFPFGGVALAWHLGRLISVLMGVVTVWATWQIALELAPRQEWLALGAAAFVAFLPEFLVISSVISNDVAVVMLSSVSVLLTLRFGRRPWSWRESVVLGVVLGFTVLAKVSGLVVWVFAAVILGYTIIKSGYWAQGVLRILSVFALAGAIGAPWFWYNWQHFGDPLALSRLLSIDPRGSAMTPNDWTFVLRQLFTSFWGRFGGAVHIRLDQWVYTVLAGGLAIVAVGWLLYARDAIRRELPRAIVALACVVALFWTVLIIADIRWIMSAFAGDQARQLFPGLSLLGVFIAAGLQRLVPSRQRLVFGVSSVLGGVFAATVLVFLSNTYAPPLVAAPSLPPSAKTVDFGDQIRVLDYKVEPATAVPGQQVTVRIYWQALKSMNENYWLLLQLAGADGVLANEDGVPSAGRLTTDLWKSGQVLVSTHRIAIPSDAPEGQFTLRLGLHPLGEWEWLAVRGQDMLDLAKLDLAAVPR